MNVKTASPPELAPETRDFYCGALEALGRAGVPFLVGGAYAFAHYTGIVRHTKDFDVFVRQRDAERVLEALASTLGCRTEIAFPHWLGKAHCGDDYVDVIFSSGNGAAEVDDGWFEYAIDAELLGKSVKLAPPEEMIWQKAMIMERERFDGADVAHILRARAESLDWPRLLRRFDSHWRVLFSHLVLFGFIYPSERSRIPDWVMDDLCGRLRDEQRAPPPADRVCQGTLLSRAQYLVDVEEWGYRDARLIPDGTMTRRETAKWTAAIEDE
jgi:hypothetical protein